MKRRLRVINHTKWRTADLRRIFAKMLAEVRRREGGDCWQINDQIVTVEYATNQGGWITGFAYYNSGAVRINLPSSLDRYRFEADEWTKTTRLVREMAAVYVHEIGHNLGIHHLGKRGSHSLIAGRPLTIEGPYLRWIEDSFDAERTPLAKADQKKAEKKDLRTIRYERACRNLATATTRLKRAKTLFAKHQAKVRYYERIFSGMKRNVAEAKAALGTGGEE